MTQENSTVIQAIQRELEAYKSDASSMKPYFESMKEISAWLTAKEK